MKNTYISYVLTLFQAIHQTKLESSGVKIFIYLEGFIKFQIITWSYHYYYHYYHHYQTLNESIMININIRWHRYISTNLWINTIKIKENGKPRYSCKLWMNSAIILKLKVNTLPTGLGMRKSLVVLKQGYLDWRSMRWIKAFRSKLMTDNQLSSDSTDCVGTASLIKNFRLLIIAIGILYQSRKWGTFKTFVRSSNNFIVWNGNAILSILIDE